MSSTLSIQSNLTELRKNFPILSRTVHGKPLVYFDNAATTQKPKEVIEAVDHYYSHENSNIHRGVHSLSQAATSKFEYAREKLQHFISAEHSEEIIFTRGTTDGINLLAFSFGQAFIKENDEIIISAMEHHSNIVPWQMLCERTGAKLKVIPMNELGELNLDAYKQLLNSRTKLVAITNISNTLGTINPVKEIIAMAHDHGAKVLIDAAQAVAHFPINVRSLDCDFLVFSMHKLFGPTGVGVLYGKRDLLNQMPPYQGGGDMIKTVSFEKTTYNCLPHKFEAGTPNIAGGIGSAAAIEYVERLSWEFIETQEKFLLDYGTQQLKDIPGVKIIGQAREKASVLSFIVEGVHPYDIGVILDQLGIAVRTGHHCTQPIMDQFGIPGTVRASFSFYNTKEEIDLFIEGLKTAIKMLK